MASKAEKDRRNRKSHFRGHPTVWIGGDDGYWAYEDTKERAGFGYVVRSCKRCHLLFEGSNEGQPDPCLGRLPGVDNACCGHGAPETAYIRFTNGITITGFDIENWKLYAREGNDG